MTNVSLNAVKNILQKQKDQLNVPFLQDDAKEK